MIRVRSLAILILFWLPVVIFTGVGAYALWESGRLIWVWWTMPVCWGLAYLLARMAVAKSIRLDEVPSDTPAYWTERDKQAWKLVQQVALDAPTIKPAELTDFSFYMNQAQDLSQQIAAFYHPKAKDPFHSLTIPEILAAAQLVIEDLSEVVDKFVPGSRQLTVARFGLALGRLPEWYNAFSNISYVVAAVFGPAMTASRYVVSKLVLGPAFQLMQDNVLLWIYTSFINRVGIYVIEMNSGRLLVGAQVWRREIARSAVASVDPELQTPEQAAAQPAIREVTIALVGQVKAGKSSLINCLLGERQAAVDILPLTNDIRRYELREADLPDKLVLLDSVGYAEDRDSAEAKRLLELICASDIVLLVLDALNPAREPDRQLVARFDDWFRNNPKYKKPPMLAVLTHIDGLRPALEWSPPYDNWRLTDSARAKEKSIREAVEYNRGLLKPHVIDVIPVCTDFDRNRTYGIDEWLFPEMLALLDEARAVFLVRTLHKAANQGKIRSVLTQMRNLGLTLLQSATGN